MSDELFRRGIIVIGLTNGLFALLNGDWSEAFWSVNAAALAGRWGHEARQARERSQ